MTIPTTALSEATPGGQTSIGGGDNRIREYKTQNREILEVDHDYPSSGQSATAGQHKKVTLQEQADLGTGATGVPILGGQTVSGKPELMYTDEDDNDIQLTSGGDVCALGSGIPMRSGDLLLSSSTTTPTGWTDVSTTYDNKFLRIGDDTPLTTTGGADTHDHGGATAGHTHSVSGTCTVTGSFRPDSAVSGSGSEVSGNISAQTFSVTSGSSTDTISSDSNVPAYIQCRMYKKD